MADPNVQNMLWPTYALRAWLTALLGQMERASDDVDTRVEAHEKEIARLRAQKQRSAVVITSLREALGSVDTVLRRTRDSETGEKQQVRGGASELQEPRGEMKRPSQDKPQGTERGKS